MTNREAKLEIIRRYTEAAEAAKAAECDWLARQNTEAAEAIRRSMRGYYPGEEC